jgi:ABC-2 type transport system ATP-binding protein
VSNVIEIDNLRKEYQRLRGGRTVAVEGLSMAVPGGGGVYGFLGPNGSGKTTTIRCMLGLVRPSAGATRVLGAPPSQLHTVISRVGSIVEAPALFPTMTGRRNLRLLGAHLGIGKENVETALARVGLGERGGDLVKSYSLGMRQRLAIAAALLKDPEVLILDEPANGLDPAGIVEIRELLRSLGAEGRTVFVSSHILGEIQHMADAVAIISRGKLITAGPVKDVVAQGRREGMVVKVSRADRAAAALRAIGIDSEVTAKDHLLVDAGADDGALITKTLAEKKLYLRELRPREVNLEQVFLELTADRTDEVEA